MIRAYASRQRRLLSAAVLTLILPLSSAPVTGARAASPQPDGLRVAAVPLDESRATQGVQDKDHHEEALPISAMLQLQSGVGLGTFAGGDQRQTQWATTIQPWIAYKVAEDLQLSTSIGGTFYHINDFGTSLEDGTFLLSDLYFDLTHGKLLDLKDLGLSVNAGIRLYLPTSLPSRFQNRIFSLRPSAGLRWKVGPVSISYRLMFMKYFSTSSTPSINCGEYGALCRDGRPAGPDVGGSFTSERQGGEVFIPSQGVNSFYVGNSLAISWQIVDGLSLTAQALIYNIFGLRSYDIDEFSSQHARAGRGQTDRLVTQISLDYQVLKQLAVGLSYGTDTTRPFGADGSRLVILDPTHAPDNISSITLAVTASL